MSPLCCPAECWEQRLLRSGFKADGEVNLIGVTIGSFLDCRGGQFLNKGHDALHADGLKVGSSLPEQRPPKQRIQSRRRSSPPGATIGLNLECSGGRFLNEGRDALSADGIVVKGNLFLDEGFQAKGAVRLIGASIGLDLYCDGGHFQNKDGYAFVARGMGVKGNVFLAQRF